MKITPKKVLTGLIALLTAGGVATFANSAEPLPVAANTNPRRCDCNCYCDYCLNGRCTFKREVQP